MLLTDQMGRETTISPPLKKIVSLVPSQTELLFDLGLGSLVAGLTKFCIHPAHGVKGKTRIGGTKNFDMERIDSIAPDLIIGNKEENYADGIASLEKKYPVWMSDIFCLGDALNMITEIGRIFDKTDQTKEMVRQIADGFARLENSLPKTPVSVLYLIWRKPYMCAGGNTFIDDMLARCGFRNLAPSARYPELSLPQMQVLAPDVLLLSSEPYPFKEKHIVELQNALPNTKIALADGEMFSWYGSRLLLAPAYFEQLLGTLKNG